MDTQPIFPLTIKNKQSKISLLKIKKREQFFLHILLFFLFSSFLCIFTVKLARLDAIDLVEFQDFFSFPKT